MAWNLTGVLSSKFAPLKMQDVRVDSPVFFRYISVFSDFFADYTLFLGLANLEPSVASGFILIGLCSSLIVLDSHP